MVGYVVEFLGNIYRVEVEDIEDIENTLITVRVRPATIIYDVNSDTVDVILPTLVITVRDGESINKVLDWVERLLNEGTLLGVGD